MNNKEEKLIKEIKEIYLDLIKVEEMNHPEFYFMPKSLWIKIMKKLQYFEDALNDCRKSRDNWRKKYEVLKNAQPQN